MKSKTRTQLKKAPKKFVISRQILQSDLKKMSLIPVTLKKMKKARELFKTKVWHKPLKLLQNKLKVNAMKLINQ